MVVEGTRGGQGTGKWVNIMDEVSSLELTEEERALVKDKTVIGASHEFGVMLRVIQKAGKMKAEWNRLPLIKRLELASDNRHDDWTDEQWLEAAEGALADTEAQ